MTMDELLLEAAEQRLLRPLDVQFALMVWPLRFRM